MIKKIKIKNFTVISNETIDFSEGLNVVIGENAVGKSHILKLVYALVSVSHQAKNEAVPPNKQMLQKMIAEKLLNVFRPDTLGRLVHRATGRKRCDIDILFKNSHNNISFYFSTTSKTDVTITKIPNSFSEEAPIFFPTREVLSIFPGFTALYRSRHIAFDETYYDLCLSLEATTLRGPRFNEIKPLIDPLETIIGGSVKVENGRFYLLMPGKGKMEIALVAEGMRKIAMLAYLITNGSLKDKGMILWDEPETNLNPKLIKQVAQTLIVLIQNGIQVFVATHSLFLLRELEILSASKAYVDIEQHYIALGNTPEGIVLTQGDSIDDIDPIVSLDEALIQSDRFISGE